MRRTVLAAIALALVPGCGGGSEKPATTATQPAKTPPAKPKRSYKPPKYFPSARHKHRPRGFIYNDEIGENVLTAPYNRIIELFGPPASRNGRCIEYHIVGQPKAKWTFCFKGQKMTSASG
jgi:hypothetical protein